MLLGARAAVATLCRNLKGQEHVWGHRGPGIEELGPPTREGLGAALRTRSPWDVSPPRGQDLAGWVASREFYTNWAWRLQVLSV